MTVKEIAEVTSRTERCVRNWIYDASIKFNNGKLLEKNASKTKRGADFNKTEVFQILRTGLGEQIASVYMLNAFSESTAVTKNEKSLDEQSVINIVNNTMMTAFPVLVDKIVGLIESRLDSKFQKELPYSLAKRDIFELKRSDSTVKIEKHSSPLLTLRYVSYIPQMKRMIFSLTAFQNEILKVGCKYTLFYLDGKFVIKKDDDGYTASLLKNGYLKIAFPVKKDFAKTIPFTFSDEEKICFEGELKTNEITFNLSKAIKTSLTTHVRERS